MCSNGKWLVVATVLLSVLSSAVADTIITKKGETWEGLVVRENENEVVLDIKGMCQMPIRKSDILKWTRDKKSFIELKTGEKYEYFTLVKDAPTEIVIKLDGVDQEMTIKKDLIKDQFFGPDATKKENKKEGKTPPPSRDSSGTKGKSSSKRSR